MFGYVTRGRHSLHTDTSTRPVVLLVRSLYAEEGVQVGGVLEKKFCTRQRKNDHFQEMYRREPGVRDGQSEPSQEFFFIC